MTMTTTKTRTTGTTWRARPKWPTIGSPAQNRSDLVKSWRTAANSDGNPNVHSISLLPPLPRAATSPTFSTSASTLAGTSARPTWHRSCPTPTAPLSPRTQHASTAVSTRRTHPSSTRAPRLSRSHVRHDGGRAQDRPGARRRAEARTQQLVLQLDGDDTVYVAQHDQEHPGQAGNWTITDANLSPDNQWMIYSSITPYVHLVPTKQNFDTAEGRRATIR